MGPAGLTAVFGMGTGVAPPVWSPGNRPAGGQARPAAVDPVSGAIVQAGRARSGRRRRVVERSSGRGAADRVGSIVGDRLVRRSAPDSRAASRAGRRRVGVVKPLGC